ncbi:hypothetical protein M422DRAFT_269108 [Sphaerobolus stellatus SS14]|uniref:Unplaced genomic scaffold SPHSTscaffold_207, whole genome shotgun sequence n=1 Tax=Sphaerobolus stellatus (strain SS14) TaxID=990650 RepID=A0A0C9TIR4_SPHS4|nr:hypothetical protein M422DRAFT_269108 [Sphaerobolus stellatus SS14]
MAKDCLRAKPPPTTTTTTTQTKARTATIEAVADSSESTKASGISPRKGFIQELPSTSARSATLQFQPSAQPSEAPDISEPFDGPQTSLTNPTPPKIPISFINAIAFNRACKLEGSQSFSLNLSNPTLFTQATKTDEPVDLSSIPSEYHDYADVFLKGMLTCYLHTDLMISRSIWKKERPPLGTNLFPFSDRAQGSLRILG